MESLSDKVEKLKTVLEDIGKYAPEEYKKLNAEPAKEEKIIQAARVTATETMKLIDELLHQPTDIAAQLSKHLSDERIQLSIRGGHEIPTFGLEIAKREDGKHWSEFTRDGKQFQPPQAISTAQDDDLEIYMQYASILIDVVSFFMYVVGISASPSKRQTQQVLKKLAKWIQTSSKLLKAVKKFVTDWRSADSANGKAIAIFRLIVEIYSTGILWTIIKFLLSDMAWYDWLEIVVKVTVRIVANIATDGVALISEIALGGLKTVNFARKIADIKQLSEKKNTP